MRRVFRPLAVFSIASGVSLAVALQLFVGGAHGQDGAREFGSSPFFPGYDLAKLELVDPTLYNLSESYVDRSRLDWDAMYSAALDAVERDVPVCMFTREPGGKLLTVEIGEYRTVLEVAPIERWQDLQSELRRVAELLAEHLSTEDLPQRDDEREPLAHIEYTIINGMLSTLDPHSVLLPPEDAKEMDVENHGEFGGLGITIYIDGDAGKLVVDYPQKDKPAHRAGLRPNDHIVRIDGESTLNMTLDDAVRMLRGPVGADVDIEVMRPNLSEPLRFTIERALISIHPVTSELVAGTDIGYISIEGFHEKVEQKLHEHLAKLRREVGGELGGLILDLRANPGGYLNQAVRVADTFLTEGDIVWTVDGEGRDSDASQANARAEPLYPVAVLVDANSASASEIVAGALRFNERAVIIGERTFGKGSVQSLHPFADESKLKLTISKYYTPGNRSIQAVGIPADIELVPAVVPEPGADDPTIQLFHRERVRREADLDHALEKSELVLDDPAYQMRFVDGARDRPRTDELDVDQDFQVRLARDVLKAARGGWRLADVLTSAHAVVATRQREQDVLLQKAFEARDIDWSYGAPAPDGFTALDVALDLGDDDVIIPGQDEVVGVEVTNVSDRPLYRVAAVLRDSDVLEGREFFFGRLGPGETRRYEQTVRLPAGWAHEKGTVTIEMRDSGTQPMDTWVVELTVAPRPRPQLAWQWTVEEEAGDGDGVLDPGETLRVHLEVENVGPGATVDPFARLRNRAGKALDLVVGTLEPGVSLSADGSPVR